VALFDQSQTLLAVVPIYGTGAAPSATLSPGTTSIVSTGGISLNYPFQAAIDGSGNLYVANYNGNNVVKIAAGGGSASVVSTGAFTLAQPAGVAVDGAGNLYIADYGHNRIVLVNSVGAASLLTITGLGTAINEPASLALDAAGNLYIADWGNSRVVKVSAAGAGMVLSTESYTLSSGGVTGVAVDASGNVYIADRVSNHIVKVAPSGTASLVSVTGLTLSNPQGVAVDGSGNLYIADSGHRRVVEVTVAGTASVVQTPGQTIGTTMFGVTVDANGNIFAVDWANNRVMKVDVSGATLSFANTAIGSTSSDSPKTATVTNLGNQPLVFSASPSYTTEFSENTSDANPCAATTSLNPGEVCDISMSFIPQTGGSRSTNVLVTNNHLNGTDVTQTVAVSGTGIKGTPVIAVDSSANPVALSDSVTLTATVTSSSLTPSGSVDFYDGATLLGSGTLVSGTATYATSSLAAGTHSVTAVYAGDTYFASVTSSAVSLVVTDLTVDIASGGSSSATVSAGGTATYHLTIAPSTGSVLPAITLSASGAPTGSTVVITPQAITAGAGTTNVTVTVQVPAAGASVPRSIISTLGLALPFVGMLVLPFGTERRRLSRKAVISACLLMGVLISVAAISGCGTSSPAPPQPKNYTVTVTATSGGASHATNLSLTVE
jgi:sugar lactone lactonase YvrE